MLFSGSATLKAPANALLEERRLKARGKAYEFAWAFEFELRFDTRAMGFDRFSADLQFVGYFPIVFG